MSLPKLTKSEKAKRESLKRAARPRIASTIVLYTGSTRDPKILMGQRSSRNDFMPSVYVFPGGRLDRSDSYAPIASGLSPRTKHILETAYNPRKARACVLAAIRETWEETGLMIGASRKWERNLSKSSWDDFRQRHITPDLSEIDVFGRAITPPHRHKRYDTWFFIQKFTGDPSKINDSGELSNVGWYSFEQIEKLETQRATQMMIQVLKTYLENPNSSPSVFFSLMRHGRLSQEQFPA